MTTIPFKDATPVLRVQNLNVTFAGSPVSVLDGISLTVRAGETLALVGESGCGKSTVASLLMGRNQGYQGSVTVGGVELSALKEESLLESFTYISHQSYLFKGTVEDNLRMAAPQATEEQLWQVLEQVSRALEVMVVLVTVCGVLLLLAQVQVGMRQRHQELVVYRTLGASKRLLRATLWSEFALLGLVAGLVAAIGAETALAVLQSKVFDFTWEHDWRLWLPLPVCGAVLLSLCGGWLGTRLLKGKALFRQFVS